MYSVMFLVNTIKATNSVCEYKYHNSLSRKFLVYFVLFVLMLANCHITKISLSFEEQIFPVMFIYFTYATPS
jgi:hypothetical protein